MSTQPHPQCLPGQKKEWLLQVSQYHATLCILCSRKLRQGFFFIDLAKQFKIHQWWFMYNKLATWQKSIDYSSLMILGRRADTPMDLVKRRSRLRLHRLRSLRASPALSLILHHQLTYQRTTLDTRWDISQLFTMTFTHISKLCMLTWNYSHDI